MNDALPPTLDFEMTYRVRVSAPSAPTTHSPHGEKQYWQVSEATLEGERISARLHGAGMDWMGVGADGYWRPDVRAQFMTADGAVVLMHYHGLVEQTVTFQRAANRGQTTEWKDQYMRLAVRFETGHAQYAWLNQRLFIGMGRLSGIGLIDYALFRVN